jgi:hypothetical protein
MFPVNFSPRRQLILPQNLFEKGLEDKAEALVFKQAGFSKNQ